MAVLREHIQPSDPDDDTRAVIWHVRERDMAAAHRRDR
jgi:hypothetical protein